MKHNKFSTKVLPNNSNISEQKTIDFMEECESDSWQVLKPSICIKVIWMKMLLLNVHFCKRHKIKMVFLNFKKFSFEIYRSISPVIYLDRI